MIVSGDFETYLDSEYTLKKLSAVEYILDPRFEAIMLALKIGDNPSIIYVGHDAIADALAKLDWPNVAWLSHNTRFDGSILAWRFGFVPRLYLDTLSMCRATTHWTLGKSSLKAVSEYLGLPPKGDAVIKAMGKRLRDFNPAELQEYQEYCARDNDNCYEIFKILRPSFTARELQLIDLVLRMFILPQVILDRDVLAEHLAEVRAEKAEALRVVADIPKETFASNPKFRALLEEHGVEVPMKKSPTTGELIPAIARNDWAFRELCASVELSPVVQAILATRQSVKSTIDETRAESLLRLSEIAWPARAGKWAPVPLKYSGARTHRLSGDGGVNFQNFRRGSTLRKALVAPDGYRIVHRDASQIEARMTAWMAGCTILLDAFEQGRDVYSEFASTVYARPVTKEDKLERFVGKTGILGLGYSCGASKFRHMLYIGAGGVSHKIEPEESQRIVMSYRDLYPEIPRLWRACDVLLDHMIENPMRLRNGHDRYLSHIPVEPGINLLWLPNDLCLSYPRLRHYGNEENNRIETCYNAPDVGGVRKLYGGKLVENISQALARIIVTDVALRVFENTGWTPWLSTHDSLDYCVPVSEAHNMNMELEREFSVAPNWAPVLPLASEGGFGLTLRDAEQAVNQ